MKINSQRAIGAMVGSAIGDALGAPFEFGPEGRFTELFPQPWLGVQTEMIGGGGCGWAAGEFTDDTQMAVILGESLLDHGGLNGADVFKRFQTWAKTASDVGNQTRAVLHDGDWQNSARLHFKRTGQSAGNGSLMRATTSALFSAGGTLDQSCDLALAQSALTHGDPAAGWGTAIYHGMIHAALRGASAIDILPILLDRLPSPHSEWYRAMLMSDVAIANEPGNGSVWTCLAQAVRVVRSTSSFEEAMRLACDVGDDVDTVACVTGGLVGATYGVQGIPSRWITHVHGTVEGKTRRNADLQELALRLIGQPAPGIAGDIVRRGPIEIRPGVWAANILGALATPDDMAVLSLCRVGDRFRDRQYRREFVLIDQEDANPGLAFVVGDAVAEINAFLDEGIDVVVHCHAGESRTALVLRAWLMQHEELTVEDANQELESVWPFVKHHNGDFERLLENF